MELVADQGDRNVSDLDLVDPHQMQQVQRAFEGRQPAANRPAALRLPSFPNSFGGGPLVAQLTAPHVPGPSFPRHARAASLLPLRSTLSSSPWRFGRGTLREVLRIGSRVAISSSAIKALSSTQPI